MHTKILLVRRLTINVAIAMRIYEALAWCKSNNDLGYYRFSLVHEQFDVVFTLFVDCACGTRLLSSACKLCL
jgi:hypothetical protein